MLQIGNRASDELEHEEAKRLILVAGLEVPLIVQRLVHCKLIHMIHVSIVELGYHNIPGNCQYR